MCPPKVFRKYQKNGLQWKAEILGVFREMFCRNKKKPHLGRCPRGGARGAQSWPIFQKFSNFEKKCKKWGAGRGHVVQSDF